MQFLPVFIMSSTLNLSTVTYQSSLVLNSKAVLGLTQRNSLRQTSEIFFFKAVLFLYASLLLTLEDV